MTLVFVVSHVLVFLFINAIAATDLNHFEFSDCGSKGVIVEALDMGPAPLLYPGFINGTMKATVKHSISSFTVTLDIERTVSNIKLPVKCYKIDGAVVGSCTYSSALACEYINHWSSKQSNSYVWMTPIMKMLGLAVKCPENVINEQRINILNERFDVPDVTTAFYSFLAPGAFKATVTVDEQDAPTDGPFFCGIFKYTLKPRK